MTKRVATDEGEQSARLIQSSKPILRWAGSKRLLIPTLLQHVPRVFNRYIEPFVGSACLFFELKPQAAVLGDFNLQLIDTYDVLAKKPGQVAAALAKLPTTPDYYYTLRSLDGSLMQPAERAARFIYLNRFSFNGVYRTNRKGQFNVPRGTKTGPLPSKGELVAAATLFRRATLIGGDFEECVGAASAGDFVYLDPPYATNGKRMRGEYGYGAFAPSDMNRLSIVLDKLHNRQVMFLLSFRFGRDAQHLFRKWHSRAVLVRRHVSGFSAHRRRVKELLIYNSPCRF